jgi:hypothetical protein
VSDYTHCCVDHAALELRLHSTGFVGFVLCNSIPARGNLFDQATNRIARSYLRMLFGALLTLAADLLL